VKKSDAELLTKLRDGTNSCKSCGGRNTKCSCYKKYFATLAVINANIPIKYRHFTFDTFHSKNLTKSVNKLRKYVDNIDKNKKAGTGLYLWGNSGSGKTSLGCIVLMEAIKKNYSCYFCVVDDYRKALFSEDSDTLDKIRTSQFLMLDDIGREFQDSKGFIGSYIDDLLRFRTDNLTPTIITSNKDGALATDSFRFESIIKEHFLMLEFNVVDYRQKLQEDLKHENA
jgi:DNA replication protein DnaC